MKEIWASFSRRAKTLIIAGAAAVLLLVVIVASCSGGGSSAGSGSAGLKPATVTYQQLCEATVGTTYTNSDGNHYTILAVQPYQYGGSHPFSDANIDHSNGDASTMCFATQSATGPLYGNGTGEVQETIWVTLSPNGKHSWYN
jgi:hypothetical protein